MKDMHSIDGVQANTFELQVGDIVLNHGCLFGLIRRNSSEHHTKPNDPVVWFDTVLLHRYNDTIPESWVHSWTIQGNQLAHWFVVRDPDIVSQFMEVYRPTSHEC